MTRLPSSSVQRFASLCSALQNFYDVRDRLRLEPEGNPPRDAVKTLRTAAEAVVLLALPYPEIVAAAAELGADGVPPEAAYEASIAEAAFAFSPTTYLRDFGSFETEINGKRMTFILIDDAVAVVGDGETVSRVAGPENITPAGWVQ